MKLLTEAASNTKTAKNAKYGNYLSYILHLAPSRLSETNVCPMASRGCIAACLNTAGRGQFNSVQAARIRKTKLYVHNRAEFLKLLHADLDAVLRKATKLKLKPVVRLNGTSDLDWIDTIRLFPGIQFYDYTKRLGHITRLSPANYHLTFSRSEVNETACVDVLWHTQVNVAVVFRGIPPSTYLNRPVISGDDHDLRFLDKPGGYIVALKAKGKAKKDQSGFVVDV